VLRKTVVKTTIPTRFPGQKSDFLTKSEMQNPHVNDAAGFFFSERNTGLPRKKAEQPNSRWLLGEPKP
jgi:hypothetical protein